MESEETEEKVFKCDVCQRTFSFPETLANHHLMHESSPKQKHLQNKVKPERVHKMHIKTESNYPYIKPKNHDKITGPGENVSHEVIISENTTATWQYNIDLSRRDVTNDQYSSENVSWPYNPEYFRKNMEPIKSTQSDVFVPNRVTWCYNETGAKPFQNVPVTSSCLDVTWCTSKSGDSKPSNDVQQALPNPPESNHTSNTAVPASFSTANQTLNTAPTYASYATTLSTSQSSVSQQYVRQQSNADVGNKFTNEKQKPTTNVPDKETEENKMYKCGICWKTYTYLETFSNHMLGHRERGFCYCNVCGEHFDYLPNLEAHLTSHKPYRCIHCDQRFRIWQNAKEHAHEHGADDKSMLEDYITYVS